MRNCDLDSCSPPVLRRSNVFCPLMRHLLIPSDRKTRQVNGVQTPKNPKEDLTSSEGSELVFLRQFFDHVDRTRRLYPRLILISEQELHLLDGSATICLWLGCQMMP